MQNVLEQGPDFWCWFDKTQFSCHCVHATHACKEVFNPNVSNCAEAGADPGLTVGEGGGGAKYTAR